MSIKYRNEKTRNGYELSSLKSALQKGVRRGELKMALYAMREIYDLITYSMNKFIDENDAEKKKKLKTSIKRVRTNLINRLNIILFEDISNITLIIQLHLVFKSIIDNTEAIFTSLEKKTEEYKRLIVQDEKNMNQIIYMMCKSEKARPCSHLRSVFRPEYINIEGNPLRIKIKGKNLQDYIEHFNKLFEKKKISCIAYAFKIHYSTEKLPNKINKSRNPVHFIFSKIPNNAVYMWYFKRVKNTKESFLYWLLPLLFYLGEVPRGKEIIYDDNNPIINSELNHTRMEFPAYVYDRHTKHALNRSFSYFAIEGAKVIPEAKWVNKEWKAFYDKMKGVVGDVKREIDVVVVDDIKRKSSKKKETDYNFVIRTQLTTSRSKTDVYFIEEDGVLKVMKGPFPNDEDTINLIRNLEKYKNIKIELGLPTIGFFALKLIPDRWPLGVPLGIRNEINRNKPAYFIIFDSLITNPAELKTRMHSSKKWPETRVVDWKQTPLHLDFKQRPLSDNEMIDYVTSLLFRYKYRLGDLADRNFLRANNRVYSIDEESIRSEPLNFRTELKKNRCNSIIKWLETNFDKLLPRLNKLNKLDGVVKFDLSKNAIINLFK
jgi:hypothetical protein